MKTTAALLIAAAIPLVSLGACSKSADTSTAAGSTADQGGAVSAPQANGAVNADGNKANPSIAPASNSFTEGEAKGHIENAGYTDITNLAKSPDGIWTADAKQGGKAVRVALDFKGAVTVAQ